MCGLVLSDTVGLALCVCARCPQGRQTPRGLQDPHSSRQVSWGLEG